MRRAPISSSLDDDRDELASAGVEANYFEKRRQKAALHNLPLHAGGAGAAAQVMGTIAACSAPRVRRRIVVNPHTGLAMDNLKPVIEGFAG